MFPPKIILCPTDFSEGSCQALAEASELALHFGAEVCLVHVLPVVPPVTEMDVTIPEVPEHQKAVHEEIDRKLHKVAEPLTAKGLRPQLVIGHGDAAPEIVRISREQDADLIVIATHGNTGWRHLAFGSVTEKVVRLATCPVLTMRMMAPLGARGKAA